MRCVNDNQMKSKSTFIYSLNVPKINTNQTIDHVEKV